MAEGRRNGDTPAHPRSGWAGIISRGRRFTLTDQGQRNAISTDILAGLTGSATSSFSFNLDVISKIASSVYVPESQLRMIDQSLLP